MLRNLYSVITPQFFAEFERPEDLDGPLTASQKRQLQQLEDALIECLQQPIEI